jgi:DNA processing protein
MTFTIAHQTKLDHEQLCAAMLAGLANMTPLRLSRLLARWLPSEAVEAVLSQDEELGVVLEGCRRYGDSLPTWQRLMKSCDLAALDRQLHDANVGVWWAGRQEGSVGGVGGVGGVVGVEGGVGGGDGVSRPSENGSAAFNALFADDDEAPAVVFYRGSLDALAHPRAAIVGTRDASPHGREFAGVLAKQLAEHDAAVVSGLARGIDSAAHAGSLAAKKGPPIAVVGTGLDVVYPSSSRNLWREVAERGLLLSERPLGATPNKSAFPARNRIIAQLAMATVVIESRETGGSLITADFAFARGRPVLVVPGSPLLDTCFGSNALLRGGAQSRLALPCLDVSDVLVWLELAKVTSEGFLDMRPTPSVEGETLLRLMGWESWTTGRLASHSPFDLGVLATNLAELEQQRWIARRDGRWYRRASEF